MDYLEAVHVHPYEDRIRTVKLYIKLGKRTGPTIRQFGYPTKNALKSWCREYGKSRDLQVVYVRSGHKYPYEQKQAAVQYFLDHDRCIASAMKAFGYPFREPLTAWIDELHPKLCIAPGRFSGSLPHFRRIGGDPLRLFGFVKGVCLNDSPGQVDPDFFSRIRRGF